MTAHPNLRKPRKIEEVVFLARDDGTESKEPSEHALDLSSIAEKQATILMRDYFYSQQIDRLYAATWRHSMKTIAGKTVFAVLPTALVAIVTGCGGTPESVADPKDDPAAQVSEAVVGTVMGSWTDWSGQVTFRLYICPASYISTGAVGVSCAVDADFAVTGGGAEICSVNPGGNPCPTGNLQWNPGALLAASFPATTAAWAAIANTRVVPTPYWLRAYAIGMKLTGVASTRDYVYLESHSAPGYVTSCGGAGGGDMVIGGGIVINWTGYGDYLWENHPNDDVSFWVGSKSSFDNSSRLTCVDIRVRPCPPGFSGCLQKGLYTWIGPYVTTGYTSSSFQVPLDSGWAMASIGGYGAGATRFLTDMIPQLGYGKGGVTIWSKDHLTQNAGANAAYAVVLAKQ